MIMTPLAILLAEIWLKDKTFHTEQGCFTTNVRMINRPVDKKDEI